MKILTTVLVFFSCLQTSYGQSLKDMDKLAAKEKACLDKGTDMVRCTVAYIGELDSMLNLSYQNLRSRLNEHEKAILKSDEKKWLQKRDAYFKKLQREYQQELKNGNGGEVAVLEWYVAEVNFIEKRVKDLINRRTSLEQNH